MSEEPVHGGNENPVMDLATRDSLDKWLDKETMSLRHAAFIAHGASPLAADRGMSADRRAAVRDTDDFLTRSIRLKPLKTVGDQQLYKTTEIFDELARMDHKFPTFVREILLKKHLIRPGTRVRAERHGNAERYEGNRIQVMHAMIRVLANPDVHSSCRKDGASDGRLVGMDVARTVIAHQQALFESGKSPQKAETIAKLFNEIVPPQIL